MNYLSIIKVSMDPGSDLLDLFREKKAKEKKSVREDKPKKIKKKDIEIIDIEERELKFYEYAVINGITVYNGIIKGTLAEMQINIEFYKRLCAHDKFTHLQPSTLTARGKFTNITFNEESYIKLLDIPTDKYATIIKIGCNFGEIYSYPNPYSLADLNDILKSIYNLHGKNLKIGCPCHPNLINTEEVYIFLKYYHEHLPRFMGLFAEVRKGLADEQRCSKKNITRFIKNFNGFIKFKLFNKDMIIEIYNIFDRHTPKQDQGFADDFLQNTIKILGSFTKYIKSCKCANQNESIEKIMGSTRGRKPTDKKASRRKKQGTGLYFSSQITFDIYNFTNKKISKIKVFRNGNFQVPGVKNPELHDLIEPIETLKKYLNYIRETRVASPADDVKADDVKAVPDNGAPIDITYILSVMRNYTCRLQDCNSRIILSRLEDALYYEKGLQEGPKPAQLNELLNAANIKRDCVWAVFKYYNGGFYSISEINNNCERYPGLLIKFVRPIPGKENKKITVKVLSSGKINFDGGTSELEIIEIYYWFQYIFTKYWDEVVYNPKNYIGEEVSPDSEDCASIYDD
jgi:hypothetical protein